MDCRFLGVPALAVFAGCPQRIQVNVDGVLTCLRGFAC